MAEHLAHQLQCIAKNIKLIVPWCLVQIGAKIQPTWKPYFLLQPPVMCLFWPNHFLLYPAKSKPVRPNWMEMMVKYLQRFDELKPVLRRCDRCVPRLFLSFLCRSPTMQFHCNVSEQWASKKRISAFYFDQPLWISLWEEKHAHPKPFRALKSLGQQHFHWATAHLTRTRLSEWLDVAQGSTYISLYILESKTRWTRNTYLFHISWPMTIRTTFHPWFMTLQSANNKTDQLTLHIVSDSCCFSPVVLTLQLLWSGVIGWSSNCTPIQCIYIYIIIYIYTYVMRGIVQRNHQHAVAYTGCRTVKHLETPLQMSQWRQFVQSIHARDIKIL